MYIMNLFSVYLGSIDTVRELKFPDSTIEYTFLN